MLALVGFLLVCLLAPASHGQQSLKKVNLILPELEGLHFDSCAPLPALDISSAVFFEKTAKKRALEESLGVRRIILDSARADQIVDGGLNNNNTNNNNKTTTSSSAPNANSCYLKAKTRAGKYRLEVPRRNSVGLDFANLGPWQKEESLAVPTIMSTSNYPTYGANSHSLDDLERMAASYISKRPDKSKMPMSNLKGIRHYLIGSGEIALTPKEKSSRTYLFIRDSQLYKCEGTTAESLSECTYIPLDSAYSAIKQKKASYEAPLTSGFSFKTSEDKMALLLIDATGRLMATTMKTGADKPASPINFETWHHYILGAVTPVKETQEKTLYNDLVLAAPDNFGAKASKLADDLDKAHIESISMFTFEGKTEWCYDSLFLNKKICYSGNKTTGGGSSAGIRKLQVTYAQHEYSPDGKRKITHEVLRSDDKGLHYVFTDSKISRRAEAEVAIAPSDIIGYNDQKCNVTISLYDFVYTVHNYDQRIDEATDVQLLKGLKFQIKAAISLANDVYFFTTANTVVRVAAQMSSDCKTFTPDWTSAVVSSSQDFVRKMVLAESKTPPDAGLIVTHRDLVEGASDSEPKIGINELISPIPGSGGSSGSSGSNTVVIVVILVLIVVALIALGIVYFFCMPCKRNKRMPKRKSRKLSSQIHNTIRSRMSNTSKIGGSQTGKSSVNLPKTGETNKNISAVQSSKIPKSPAKSRLSLRQSPSKMSKRVSSPSTSKLSSKVVVRSPSGAISSLKASSNVNSKRSPSPSHSPSGASNRSLSPSSPGASGISIKNQHHNHSASSPHSSPTKK